MLHSVLRRGPGGVWVRSALMIAIPLFALPGAAAGQSATFIGLGHMPVTMPGGSTYVNAVSGDRSTIVGYTWVSGSATVPFRWTAATGYQSLGTLGGTNSPNNIAYGVSFDGSVVVGQSALPNQNLRGFRWTASTGMVELEMGPLLSQTADAVSADGLTSAQVPGDVNDDGIVNVADFLALLSAWGPCPAPPADCPADVIPNGTVDVSDLLFVLSNWS